MQKNVKIIISPDLHKINKVCEFRVLIIYMWAESSISLISYNMT